MKLFSLIMIVGLALTAQAGVVYQNYFGDIIIRPAGSGNIYVYRGRVYYRSQSGVTGPRRFYHNQEIRNDYNSYYRHNYGYRNILQNPYQQNYLEYRARAQQSAQRYRRSLPSHYPRNPYKNPYQ